MPISSLENLLRVFGGGTIEAKDQQCLFCETLLMTLARTAYADKNLAEVEVPTALEIYKAHTGQEVEVGEFRHAARSELFESTPLPRYISKAASSLSAVHKREIIAALAELIRVDKNISPNELDFFNAMAKSLGVTYADVAGLAAGN